MQLILVISKGAETKSKFPFEKRVFSPVNFPQSVFLYKNFFDQEGWKIFVALIV